MVPMLPSAQYDALWDLYMGTDGANWNWQKPYTLHGMPWDFSGNYSDPCADGWQGIICMQFSDDSNNVHSLILTKYGLRGALSDSIADLSFLNVLMLGNNNLTGTIPVVLSAIPTLEVLRLEQNAFTGTIPAELSQLALITELSLGYNQLHGTIPAQFFRGLRLLNELDFSSNKLTGTIPEGLGNASSLQLLYLYKNRLTGSIPASTGELALLKELDLSVNNITGTMPQVLCNLVLLEDLILSEDHLNGSIPSCITALTELLEFNVYLNQLTGPLPANFTKLHKLRICLLRGNLLTGTLPEDIGDMRLLTILEAYGNPFHGTLPLSLGKLENLIELQLGSPLLTGPIPEVVCNMTALTGFFIVHASLTGTIPNCLDRIPGLANINLYNNKLTGTIPETIAELPELYDLQLYSNNLTGTISPKFGDVPFLISLVIAHNSLNGTIPASLGNLTNFQNFIVGNNSLTGSIPEELFKYRTMRQLSVNDNQLTGTIPEAVALMHSMDMLSLDNNLLTGTLPEEVLALPLMGLLTVGNNFFTGTLPPVPETVRDVSMLTFEISNNQFSGTIPLSYCGFTFLANMAFNGNLLNGTLPECLFTNLTYIDGFDFSYNYFTGTLSELVANIADMHDLILSNNYFTGTIPQSITGLTQLSELLLESNLFTGTIPERIGDMQLMTYFGVQNNSLRGSIPSSVETLTALEAFDVSYNQLTGTIPGGFEQARALLYFDVSNNQFHGTLPSFRQSSSLQLFLVGYNQLTGAVAGVFNYSQTQLNTVDISYNQFTGKLPNEAFTQDLQNFVAVSNCFSGSIPPDICSASPWLEVLVLDGISAATSCQVKILPGLGINTYSLANTIEGGVPGCLFGMSAMETLHLSGNGLAGTLSSSLTVSPTLRDLSLSNNRLSGTIPSQLQQHAWRDNFDLSYNKFTGTIDAHIGYMFANSTIVNLEVNRLSGIIPSSLSDVQSIDILDSNLFTCDYRKSSLPRSDSDYREYECGSNSFDLSIYAWLVIMGVAATVGVVLWQCGGENSAFNKVSECVRRFQAVQAANFSNLQYYGRVVRGYGSGAIVATAVVLVVVYGVLTYKYGTYTHEYAWTVSAAFIAGLVPGIVLFCTFCIILLSILIATLRFRAQRVSDDESTKTIEQQEGRSWKFLLKLGFLFMVNFGVTVLVNAAYVYIAINYSNSVVTGTQLAMALYKLLWNRFAIPVLMRGLLGLTGSTRIGRTDYILQVMELFNNIVAPCLATAAISSDCFYNVVETAPQVSSSFTFRICSSLKVITSNCNQETTVSSNTFYTPPFTYSYQCSSVLVTNYAAVFVYMFLFTTFAKPLAYGTLEWMVGKDGDFFSELLPVINRPVVAVSIADLDLQVFDRTMFLISLYAHLAILFTFGVVFPPLMFVIGLSLFVNSYYNEFLIGRYLLRSNNQESIAVASISLSLLNLSATAQDSLLFMVKFSAVFYSLFIFDIIGDRLGWVSALIAMLVMITFPLLAQAGLFLWRSRKQSASDEKMSFEDTTRESTQSARHSATFGNVKTTINPISSNKTNNSGISSGISSTDNL